MSFSADGDPNRDGGALGGLHSKNPSSPSSAKSIRAAYAHLDGLSPVIECDIDAAFAGLEGIGDDAQFPLGAFG